VISPAIQSSAQHRFRDGSLCLYYPKDGSWHDRLYIAATIIPWTAEWLFYYEYWMKFGNWLGPEAPHETEKKPS
jgi:hypothetical protein